MKRRTLAVSSASAVFLGVSALAGCAGTERAAIDPAAMTQIQLRDHLVDGRHFIVREGPGGMVRYSIIGVDGRTATPQTPADEVLYFQPEILRDLNLAITDKGHISQTPVPLLRR